MSSKRRDFNQGISWMLFYDAVGEEGKLKKG